MTNKELATRYRNLIIVLARYQQAQEEGSKALRSIAEFERFTNRKEGLLAKANSISKSAKNLSNVIRKNKAAMRFFFQTTDIPTVAQQKLEYDNYLLTILEQESTVDHHVQRD